MFVKLSAKTWRIGMLACCMASMGSLSLFAQGTTTPVVSPVRATDQTDSHPRSDALRRVIAVHVDRVSLRSALSTIATAADIKLTFAADEIPDVLVTVTSDRISVADALATVLQGTDLGVLVLPSGRIAIGPKSPTGTGVSLQQGTGTISGSVRDSATGAPLPKVAIRVDGTALEVLSGTDGHFKITGVAAGEYRVTARRVGLVAQTRTVTAVEGETKTIVFLLNPPATKLDEVVTTALGEQRRYEVGNVIATINVDSIAPTAPVTSVTDLIEGRAAGVEVEENSGLVGSGEAIRIRGQSSLLVQGDPILIVDGVRQDNAAGNTAGTMSPLYNFVPSPSRINDLDFSQIETIDILKGPAATTEYGTDAANGVIVITTKRGASGSPAWHASAQQAASLVPDNFPNLYYTWGHYTDGTQGAVNCALVPTFGGENAQYGRPNNVGADFGTCVADSVTKFNPLNHANTTMFGTGPSNKYDLDVSGGSETLRYYLAGGLSNATGAIKLPDVLEPEAIALGVPRSQFDPNGLNQRSIKANVSLKMSNVTDVQLNVGYTSTYQETSSTGSMTDGIWQGIAIDDSLYDYGYGWSPYSSAYYNSPLVMLSQIAHQQTDAFTGGGTVTMRPTAWLVGHGTFGVQHESQEAQQVSNAVADIVGFQAGPNDGGLGYASGSNDVYTVDLRLSATNPLSRELKLVSSLGVQMVDSRSDAVQTIAYGLTQQNAQSLNAGNYLSGSQTAARSATLGGYLEEQFGFFDKLFITAALRIDAGSGFGSAYNTTTYPKLSASWLALDNGATSVRFRAAFGGAGKQPPAGAPLQTYYQNQVLINNAATPVLYLQNPGTPGLQPERTTEGEGGVDVALWRNRLTIEITGYTKTTQNAIFPVPLGFEFLNASQYENIGEITNGGLEETISATVLSSRSVVWTAMVNSSINTNKLVHLAPGITTSYNNAGAWEQFAPGYPLYGLWGDGVQYSDVNHDGILEPDEVFVDTIRTFHGTSLPKYETSVSSHLGLWRGTVAIGTLFDYQSGFKVTNFTLPWAGAFQASTVVQNRLGGPLWQQAQEFNTAGYGAGQVEDGTFLRWRELNVTYALPMRMARSAHLSSLSLTAAVRNLALWTHYQGDPEAAGSSYAEYGLASNLSPTVNNDLRDSYGDVPLMQSWTLRLNLGF